MNVQEITKHIRAWDLELPNGEVLVRVEDLVKLLNYTESGRKEFWKLNERYNSLLAQSLSEPRFYRLDERC